MRKLPAIIAAAGLLVTLSACSSTAPSFAGCTPGDNASLVDSDASFPTPLISPTPEFAIAKAGDGARINSGDVVEVTTSLYDAETGEALQDDVAFGSFVEGEFQFTRAFSCATVGSTIVVTGAASDLLGPDEDSEQQLVLVSTVEKAYPARATGIDQLPQSGFPGVVLAPNGRPGITFPSGDAPSELKIAASKQGSGATIEEGDSLVVNLTAVVWGADAPFTSSWENSSPIGLTAASLADSETGVVPGLAKALIGQQVGSQLLVVVPPSAGYPETAAPPEGVAAGDTLFYVVDILSIR